LLTAETKPGYETAGPIFELPLDPDHIIGLQHHQIADRGRSTPLLVHIPVTERINRTLRPLCMTIHIPMHTNDGVHQPVARIPVRSVGLEPLKRHWWLRLKEHAMYLVTLPEKEQPRFVRLSWGIAQWREMMQHLQMQERALCHAKVDEKKREKVRRRQKALKARLSPRHGPEGSPKPSPRSNLEDSPATSEARTPSAAESGSSPGSLSGVLKSVGRGSGQPYPLGTPFKQGGFYPRVPLEVATIS
jgi:hypothetical protein